MRVRRVQINSRVAEALLKSDEVVADLRARTRRIAAQAGPGFEAEVTVGRKRALGSVTAVTPAAQAAEANSRALTRALDAGR